MSLKVIFFDLDDTLVDRKKVFTECLYQQLAQDFPNQPERLKEAVESILSWDHWANVKRVSHFVRLKEKYPDVVRSAEEINSYWEQHNGEQIHPMEDAKEVLDYLSTKYRLGIISNGSPISQRRKIDRLPFADMFEYIIVSGELGIHKPDAGIFLHACEKMGVSPKECAYVGDNPICDIQGALGVGMRPFWMSEGYPHENEKVICIEQLSDLKKYL